MKSTSFHHLLVALILCLFFFESHGQSNPYVHYSVPDGLPSSETYNVFQDKSGFIWFATDNGVVRFDGKDMELFQANAGLTDPVVFEFLEDSKQRIWFRTFSGRISYFFNEKIYPYQYNDSLYAHCRSSYLQSLHVDAKDQVWFGSALELCKIDTSGKISIENRNDPYRVSFLNIKNKIIYSTEGTVITKGKINGKNVDFQLADSCSYRSIVCNFKWKGQQYFSHGRTIYKMDDRQISPVFHSKGQIIALTIDREDNLWIGYFQDGLECYTDFGIKKPDPFDFTRSKSITQILQDREGGFWLTTLEDGIYYVPHFNFLEYPLPPDLKINKAISWNEKAIVTDVKGGLGILEIDGKIKQERKLGGSILSILKASEKRLWVSTTSETILFDDLFNIKKSIPKSFSDLHLAKDGTIWGTSGLVRVQYDQECEFLNSIVSTKTNRSIYTNERFTFLFGRLGLQVFTPKNKEVKLPTFFDALKVTQILEINDSLLLMGTLGSGLLLVNQNRWTYEQYYSKHKFVANNVYAMIKEGPDVWIGTEKGVAITTLNSIISGTPNFSFFITKNKAGNNRINHLVSLPEHVLAFSEDSYFTLPKEIKAPSLAIFRLQTLLVNNQPYTLDADQKLDFDQNNIQVNFRFIDFRNQDILVRSRLSPKDPWNYSSDRNIKFYSLRSEKYFLEIEYSIDNIHWHKAIAWNFTILPPWWRTWYFITSIILITLLWVAIYFRRRVARVHERNNYLNLINTQQQRLIRAELDTLEGERNRIAKDLHDSVGTNLTAIKMTVRSILKKYNDSKAEAVENEFQNTIQDIKGIIHDLVPAGLDKYGLSETIRSHAAKIEESLDIKIEVNTFGPDTNDPRLNLLSFRILQELISNTLKHAQASKVVIHISSFEDLLSIVYQDNGKGFDSESVAKGSGLFNIQSRVQTANGTLKFESGNFGVSYIIDIPLNLNGHDQNNLSR